MAMKITVTLYLDVGDGGEAYDAVNEILREQQRAFTPSSCLIDYAQGEAIEMGGLPRDYTEGAFTYFFAPDEMLPL